MEFKVVSQILKKFLGASDSKSDKSGIDYEGFWDGYAKRWAPFQSDQKYIGDEWAGVNAGAAKSIDEYKGIIENSFIKPYITSQDSVIELGIGGGRTAEILLKYCKKLLCCDISSEMINATRDRLMGKPIDFYKIENGNLSGIAKNSADVFFSYDSMVHIEPRDIYNYLVQIPTLMKQDGKRLCIFHHSNVLSELGFKKFLSEYKENLMGNRSGGAFSVMTDSIMEKFLSEIGYSVILKDTTTVPRDCVWVCKI